MHRLKFSVLLKTRRATRLVGQVRGPAVACRIAMSHVSFKRHIKTNVAHRGYRVTNYYY